MTAKTIKELKKGEWFTLKPIEYPKESQVYERQGYDRELKKYEAYKYEDISVNRYFKGDKVVYVDFTF